MWIMERVFLMCIDLYSSMDAGLQFIAGVQGLPKTNGFQSFLWVSIILGPERPAQ